MNSSNEYVSARELRQQLDLAQVCAVLAVTIALAVLIGNFGMVPEDLVRARLSVMEHAQILRAHEELLEQNEIALRQAKGALPPAAAPTSTSRN